MLSIDLFCHLIEIIKIRKNQYNFNSLSIAFCVIHLSYNAKIALKALTGINNRYRVREYLEKIWDHTTEKNPVVIYLIDINKFKGINDQYGHLIGDQALVAVADSLKVIATEGIVIDRFGGDEFILADPLNHDPQSIQKELREELRKASLAHHFPFDLTLSIGYAKATQACQKYLILFP